MKKLLLPLLSILLFTACQKEVTTTKAQDEIAGATANKQTKFFVCHYDAITATWKTIQVDQSALAGHLAHGDVQGECSAVQTVTICDQVWMVKNLDVDTYRDGTTIPQAATEAEWIAAGTAGTGAWCYYENSTANGTVYGKLYNCYAVNDPRGLAPTGWHIPTTLEWVTLADCLGGDIFGNDVAGGKLKSVGTIEAATGLWYAPNTDATNSSGFTGFPGGLRIASGTFYSIGQVGLWWGSDLQSTSLGFLFGLSSYHADIFHISDSKQLGTSVRCLRD
jgi:uncharacterized protein (TIGR02145 family)